MKLFLFLVVIFFANAVQAITGFAGTVLAMPPSILLLGIDEAKVVLTVMAFLSCFFIAVEGRSHIHKKETVKITIFMLFGMFLGGLLYESISSEILLPLYGLLIILIGLRNLTQKKKATFPKETLVLILFFSGVIHGLFVSGGALLVLYATEKFPEKAVFRSTISSVWVILNSLLLFSYGQNGLFTAETITVIFYSILPLIVATYLGTHLQKKMNQAVFLKLTYILLVISGASLIL